MQGRLAGHNTRNSDRRGYITKQNQPTDHGRRRLVALIAAGGGGYTGGSSGSGSVTDDAQGGDGMVDVNWS